MTLIRDAMLDNAVPQVTIDMGHSANESLSCACYINPFVH